MFERDVGSRVKRKKLKTGKGTPGEKWRKGKIIAVWDWPVVWSGRRY